MTQHMPKDQLVESILRLKRVVSDRAVEIEKALALADETNLSPHLQQIFGRLRNANRRTSQACNLVGESYTMLLDLVLVQRMLLDWTNGNLDVNNDIAGVIHEALADASKRSNAIADSSIDIYSDIKS